MMMMMMFDPIRLIFLQFIQSSIQFNRFMHLKMFDKTYFYQHNHVVVVVVVAVVAIQQSDRIIDRYVEHDLQFLNVFYQSIAMLNHNNETIIIYQSIN